LVNKLVNPRPGEFSIHEFVSVSRSGTQAHQLETLSQAFSRWCWPNKRNAQDKRRGNLPGEPPVTASRSPMLSREEV